MLRSDVPRALIIGATSLVIHCATASAIGQRSVTGSEKTARWLSGKRTASTMTTSVAVHAPGPVIGGEGLKEASSASRSRQGEGAMSDSGVEAGSDERASGRSRGSGGSAVAAELVASRKVVAQSKLAEKFRHAPKVRRLYMRQESPNMVHAFPVGRYCYRQFIIRTS